MISRRSFLAATPLIATAQTQSGTKLFGNAQAYEGFMGRWSRLLAPLLIDFAQLPASGRILDVGSGTGSLSSEIARRTPALAVTGIDLSDDYIAFAKSKTPYPDRVTFKKGDAQAIDFPDRTFAASVSLLVFNFIPDAAKAIREVRRVTQRDGPIAAAVWDYGEGMRMLRVFWDAAGKSNPSAGKLDEKYMRLSQKGELGKLWREAGLSDVREQPLEIEMKFRNFADYWDPFLIGQGPAGAYVQRLDDAGRKVLRTAVLRELSLDSETQPFTLTARVWAVRGRVPLASSEPVF